MDRLARIAELSGEIRSRRLFCEFIESGGRVIASESDGGPWTDVTAATVARECRRIEALERTRRRLMPEEPVRHDRGR